jgi:Ca-activated chloride channel family protein
MPKPQEPKILLTPLKSALTLEQDQSISVLIRVQAPDAAPVARKTRKPYHLAIVIDRSGSMSGEPLTEAVRCAKHVIDQLEPTDSVALIAFDDRVKTLVPCQPIGNRLALHSALASIRPGGSTNLHGGWLAGMEALKAGAKDAVLARVILLSDGVANVGAMTGTEEIATLCASAAEEGFSTSTYGLGTGFNEDLMVEMGRKGRGNHYYGDTAADLFEPFATEFDFISNLYAQRVCLSLAAPESVGIKLLNDYTVKARDGFHFIQLPDIPMGAEAWAVVELQIPAALAISSGMQILQVGVTARDTEGAPIAIADETLRMKAVTAEQWSALPLDAAVLARKTELEAGRFIEQARAAARAGDWAALQAMLAEATQRFADHPWVVDVLSGLAELAQERNQERFSKEAMYTSRSMNSRISAKDEGGYDVAENDESPSYVVRKKFQGKARGEPRPDDTKP